MSKGYSSFPRAESFLCFMCMVMPGMSAVVLLFARRFLSAETAVLVLPALFSLVLLGSCYFAGYIAAIRVTEDKRTVETWKSALTVLLLQIALVPLVGLLAFALIGRLT